MFPAKHRGVSQTVPDKERSRQYPHVGRLSVLTQPTNIDKRR